MVQYFLLFHFIYIIFIQNCITFTLLFDNFKTVSLDSSGIKVNRTPLSQSGVLMKLICCIIFGSV